MSEKKINKTRGCDVRTYYQSLDTSTKVAVTVKEKKTYLRISS